MSGILGDLVGPAKLVVIKIGKDPEQFKVETEIEIGKQSFFNFKNDAKLALEYSILSKTQSRIVHALGDWHYKNLTDENVTTINDEEIPPDRDRILNDGDVIRIKKDDDILIFIFIVKFKGDIAWKRIQLDKEQSVYHIYSHLSEDNVDKASIGPLDTTGEVTHHAIIRFTEGHWQLEDADTSGTVLVNQNAITGTKVLNLYDVINIGSTHFVFVGDYIAYNQETFTNNNLTINIQERSVRNIFKKHILLKDISLTVEPGNMVLILGGSGAGKTTFINAVTGYEKAKADIKQGDIDVYDDYDKMKYKIGMVPQQDLLRGEDTVVMTLSNAAEMRMPNYASVNARKERVQNTLELFGLDTVKGELVEKLSGGQRKRLSIAIEFVADPSLFILDEPDSGLDGVMARDLMKQLRHIADQNKIVMVITHTPDRVVDLFDKVIVLAKNSQQTGQLAFYGTVAEAREFFGKNTMEEIILAINSEGEGGEGQADLYIEKFAKYRSEANANG
ncbi:ATP-binding cassette domain-containing protein [Oribacterium sp. WCC10]|uniref:ATP-binding cassette domain-containing protein n=1 Tax=Oribacterium sp. WCC10 TaxID=1855343 RepID=UPI0008E53BDD|nr:ATP-binding cassette domain-containing protein [Oribacterium sp. WCC10]SFG61920.1 ABC-type multidrug transport system, ATPase component [Oribacterium sp. WCC10]